ncbi:hypothetical protein HRI_003350000 [Hibiscus trionum]|uniref:Uncharacterized protein n=1 Tax=Hibiscus trionum TaxID=183268 RepID=A0A9W7IHK2_HIBTR|nr:hypothetical protein HRI_003350000 [Hibiscus trionum]
MNIDPSCEYDGIDEDDVFYAEIRRQILLLTEEDDEDYQVTKTTNSLSNRAVANLSSSLPHRSYFSWLDNHKTTNSVPSWLSNLWRNNNETGTGVFIPLIKRCHRPERMRKRKAYKPMPVETKHS